MNVVVLIGRLTANPELRKTNSDISVCRFSIAVDRRFTRQGEERQADFINIVVWRQQAEFVTKYFTKGQLIAIEGSLQMNRFKDKDGNDRTTYEVVANNVSFVGSKRESGGEASAAVQSAPQSFSNGDTGDFTEIGGDDDLPF